MRRSATLLVIALVMSVAPVAFAEPPSNDNFAQAEEVTLPFADSTDTSEATTELGEPITQCETRPTQNTVWYRFTATSSQRIFVDTIGSDFDTVIGVFIEDPYGDYDGIPFGGMYSLGCEDSRIEDEFSLWVDEGYTYYFQVGGHIDAPAGVANFNVKLGGSIAGTVTTASGAPISEICVEALQEDPYWGYLTYFGGAETLADGTYEIESLPSGDYIVTFWDCGYERPQGYEAEVYNNRQLIEDADMVSVQMSATTAGIDASLAVYVPPPPPPPIPTNLSVSDLKVTNVPVHTDYGPVGYTGLIRQIDAQVKNLSDKDVTAFVRLRACEAGGGGCISLYQTFFEAKAGSTINHSYRWDALGWAGDVRIEAEVCPVTAGAYDTDQSDDFRSVDHYVLVGGIGRGRSVTGTEDPYNDYYHNPCRGGDYGGPIPRPVPSQ